MLTAHEGANVNTVKIEFGKETTTLIAVLLLILTGCGVVMGLNLAKQARVDEDVLDLKRQYRMTELKLDDWTVVAHRSGLVLPGDYTRGPQGNLDSNSFQEKDNGSRRDNQPARSH